MLRRRSLRRSAVLLLLLGAVLRAVFLWKHPRFAGDTLLYGDLAQNMLLHHIYGFTEATRIRSTLIRLPGYPGFLAACFWLFGLEDYTAALRVQAAADLLNCWLLSRLAARVMGERIGLIALGLAALCPFTANYCAVGLTETWSLLCVALALLSLDAWLQRAAEGKPWNAWLLGLTFALSFAVLLRPDQSLLAAAVLPVMLIADWRRLSELETTASEAHHSQSHAVILSGAKDLGVPSAPLLPRRESLSPTFRIAPVAAVCAGVLLPLLLWSVRNWRVLHVVEPLAPKYANDPGDPVSYGFYRWYRTWAIEYKSNLDIYWTYDGEPLRMADLPPRAYDNPQQKQATAAIFARYNQETASTPPVEAAFAHLAAERVRAHPLSYYVLLPGARLANMWLRPRTEFMRLPLDWWNWRAHPLGSAPAAAYGLLNLLLLAFAVRGFLRWKALRWAGHRPLAWAALGFVALRCALLLTLDNSEPRYTIECYPIVLLLASYAFARRRDA